jgi:hypothetical protein
MSYASSGAVATLATAVATSGTFTVPYPTGFSRGDFVDGAQHRGYVNQTLVNCPVDFGVTLNATNVTVTWRRAGTLPAGSVFRLELEILGNSNLENRQYVAVGVPGTGASIQGARGLTPIPVRRLAPMELVSVRIRNPTATNSAGLRAAAAVGVGGALTLITAALVFDVPRNVTITSSGVDTARVFTITGVDEYGSTVIETITGVNAATVAGIKAFASITSISVDAACAGNISCGWGAVFGLPFWIGHIGAVLYTLQDGAAPSNAPTTVAGLASSTVSTATTADVRGTFAPNTNAANVPDGSRTYTLVVAGGEPWYLGNPQFGS